MSDINLVISYDNGNIDKVSKEAETKLGRAGKEAGKDFSSGFRAAIPGVLGQVAKIGSAIAAVAGGLVVFKSIEAAQEQENAVNRLAGALRSAGDFSREALSDFESFAAELQEVSKIGDEVTLSQLALAKGFGASNEQAKQIVAAAADLSVALGIDLESATRNVSKTLGGYAGELGEVIPELKNFTQEQLQSGAAIDIIAGKFQGLAQNELQTFSGALTQTQNSFGDLLEQIGSLITQNPLFIRVLNSLNRGFQQLGNFIAEFVNNGGIGRINQFLQDLANDIFRFFIRPLEVAFNVSRIVFLGISTAVLTVSRTFTEINRAIEDTTGAFSLLFRIGSVVVNGLQTGFDLVLASITALAEKAVQFVGLFTDVSGIERTLNNLSNGAFKNFEESAANTNAAIEELFSQGNNRSQEVRAVFDLKAEFETELLDSTIASLNESVDNVFNTGTTDALQARVNDTFNAIKETTAIQTEEINNNIMKVDEAANLTANSLLGVFTNLQFTFTSTAKQLKATAAQIGGIVKNGLVGAISGGIQTIINSLAAGENAFAALSKFVLGAFGDLAIQLGQTLIGAGLGVEALKSLGGTAAIAAGAGLVALGAIIKSFIGGGGSSPTTSFAPNSGGPGSIGTFSSTSDTIDDDFIGQAEGTAEARTVINLTVEGNSFGNEEFARQVAESISEEGGKQGLVFNNFQTA